MRKWLMVAVVLLALVVPALAQDVPAGGPLCCREDATGIVKPWDMLGKCPEHWTKVDPAECGVIPTPTPVVVPTEVPTPVPTVTPPDDFVPKDVTIPTYVKWIGELAAQWYGKTLIIPAGVMAILIWLTNLLRSLAPKLKGRWAFACTAAITGITMIASLIQDLKLEKGEWWPALVALLFIIGAPLGYRLTTGKVKDAAVAKARKEALQR